MIKGSRVEMNKERSQQRLPHRQILNPDDLRVWQHPTLVNAIEILEVFSIDPGDGMLAASLILASDQLIKHLQRHKGDLVQVQTQAMLATRDRAFEWLRNDVDSAAYDSDPWRSTSQIGKALNCALLLFCAQLLQRRLPRPTRKKAYAYITYMSEQGWPRDDLLPFIVSQLEEPRELIASAKQHLLTQIGCWRSQPDIRGLAFALIRYKDQLEAAIRDELIAMIKARFATTPTEMSDKTWGLLALSGVPGIAEADLDRLAKSLLDELAQDRLVSNEITPTVRLINQFPFSTPDEIAHRVNRLKQVGYAPASRIARVHEEGVLIDMFEPSSDGPWSFALSATQVAFAVYALIATGYHQIVGFPAHYRAQLEESVKKHADLQLQKATVIPVRYFIWHNIFAVLVWLELGGVIGALVAELSGWNWSKGGLVGIALAALASIRKDYTRESVIEGMWETIRKWLENLLGALSKK
jgi:hypothetical protein